MARGTLQDMIMAFEDKLDDLSTNESLTVEGLEDRIRKNELDYNDEIDAWEATDGDTSIQFQDRETHSWFPGEKSPRISSNTWGRVWKDGKMVYNSNGPKFGEREKMAKFLSDESLSEDFSEANLITDLNKAMWPVIKEWHSDIDKETFIKECKDRIEYLCGMLTFADSVEESYNTKENKAIEEDLFDTKHKFEWEIKNALSNVYHSMKKEKRENDYDYYDWKNAIDSFLVSFFPIRKKGYKENLEEDTKVCEFCGSEECDGSCRDNKEEITECDNNLGSYLESMYK